MEGKLVPHFGDRPLADIDGHDVEDLLDATAEWLELLSSEPDRVRGLMQGAITRPCSIVDEELTWWRWSWGVELTIEMDPGGELGQAGRELAQRCPDVMTRTVSESFMGDHVDEVVREVCGQIESSLGMGGVTTQTRTLWAWVDELEAREEMLRPPPSSSTDPDQSGIP